MLGLTGTERDWVAPAHARPGFVNAACSSQVGSSQEDARTLFSLQADNITFLA